MKKEFSVIFDLDGTLIDSQWSILMSLEAALKDLKLKNVVPFSKELIGPPLFEIINIVCGSQDIKNNNAVTEKFKKIYDQVGYKHSKIYDGVVEVLTYLKKKAIVFALLPTKENYQQERFWFILS
jgi:phosphoglycolate phosphatase-like HAD superfamily hydrolase